MIYRFEVRDEMGRLWLRTLTRHKAIRKAVELEKTKGIKMNVMEAKS